MAFGMGNIITFSYIGKRSHDPKPKVYVMHPNWRGCCHGLALKQIPNNYIELIKFLTQKDFSDLKDKNLYKAYYRWKNLMPPKISPLIIYNTFVSRIPAIRRAYRKYKPQGMSGVRILSTNL
jgi:hypothetical protein